MFYIKDKKDKVLAQIDFMFASDLHKGQILNLPINNQKVKVEILEILGGNVVVKI